MKILSDLTNLYLEIGQVKLQLEQLPQLLSAASVDQSVADGTADLLQVDYAAMDALFNQDYEYWPQTEPGQPTNPTNPGGGGTTVGVTSQDPNSKTGGSGYGQAGYIAANSPLPYQVDFENDPTATAPAQQVVVTDQLDPSLDWKTLQFTAVGFGDNIITDPGEHPALPDHGADDLQRPDLRRGHRTRPECRHGPGLRSLPVDRPEHELAAQQRTRRVSCRPRTAPAAARVSFPTRSSLIRDCPPARKSTTSPWSASTGAETIATNQVDPHDPSKGIDPAKECLNTIDAAPPTSNVAALPATETSTSFTVSWSGKRRLGGSGIASYDVYVSDNGGSFQPWLTSIADTSATYTVNTATPTASTAWPPITSVIANSRRAQPRRVRA